MNTSNDGLATFTIGHPDDGKSTVKTIHLQIIGLVKATEAQNLKVGFVTIWNFGATEEIVEVLEGTPKFVKLIIRDVSSGSLHERKLKKTRLVGIK